MSTQHEELQQAVAFLRQFPGARSELDFSVYSIRAIDYVLADSYQNGKLRKPDGKFGKYQGRLLLGISGYITEVIIRHTKNTQIVIDAADEKWYLHFKLVAENGSVVQPAQQVLKRTQEGLPGALHPFTLATIKQFNPQVEESIDEVADKKPWWKFW